MTEVLIHELLRIVLRLKLRLHLPGLNLGLLNLVLLTNKLVRIHLWLVYVRRHHWWLVVYGYYCLIWKLPWIEVGELRRRRKSGLEIEMKRLSLLNDFDFRPLRMQRGQQH